MRYSGKAIFAWLCGTLFVGINILGIGLSHHRRKAEAAVNQRLQQVKGKQGEVLAKWHSDDPVPLRSVRCRTILAGLTTADELDIPEQASPLARTHLEGTVANDLTAALADLVVAYQRGTLSALVDYMESREQSLAPAAVERIRNYLVDRHGYQQKALAALAPLAQMQKFWDVFEVAPNWEALIAKDSSVHLWQASQVELLEAVNDPEDFDDYDARLWMRRAHIFHNFANAADDDLEKEFERSGSVRVADARLVIKHKGEGVHSICPYAIRFWYNTALQKWIPHLMLQFRTSADIPTRLIF